ncbi:MAG: dethiobiotin synthase [Thermodesulfovibrionia bacterium]
MKGIFITGTDTGVGKTFVGMGIIEAMKEKGINVCPMKPVETGCGLRRGRLIPHDTLKLLKASGVDEEIDMVNPYRFKRPLAPMVSAMLEGTRIQKGRIISRYRYLSERYDLTLVEGAGGIMVPLYKGYLYLDLIKELKLPIVIVSRPSLGTINHTLLTIEIARREGIDIIGVIINYAIRLNKGIAERTNPDVIEKLGGVRILGVVPHVKDSNSWIKRLFHDIAKYIIEMPVQSYWQKNGR